MQLFSKSELASNGTDFDGVIHDRRKTLEDASAVVWYVFAHEEKKLIGEVKTR